MPLFNLSQLYQGPTFAAFPDCAHCGLHLGCESPKMSYRGEGQAGVLFVVDVPGSEEDAQDHPLAGESEAYLRFQLRKLGYHLDQDCWMIGATACYSPKGNRKKMDTQIDYCRPNVLNAIKELNPTVIIPLGENAVASVLTYARNTRTNPAIAQWAGWQIPSQRLNAWICPTYRPDYVQRLSMKKRKTMENTWIRHLRDAFQKVKHRPWEQVPDFGSQVQIAYNADDLAQFIAAERPGAKYMAYDFETNMLKPDLPESKIVCCSLAFREDAAIAYPWTDETAQLTAELATDAKLRKIGANIKFEHRWLKRKLGITTRNWAWDTVVNAHIIDPRKGITGVKFQAFVLLGMPSYSDHLDDYLKGDGSYGVNKIKKINGYDLLRYCGLDSLLEFRVAMMQMEALGIKP